MNKKASKALKVDLKQFFSYQIFEHQEALLL